MNRGIFFIIPLALARILSADTIGTFSIDTSMLDPTQSWTLDFQFIDGSGGATGDNNNQVSLTHFDTGGGSITPVLTNGSGINIVSSPYELDLFDADFFNEIQYAFTPGTTLSFQIDTTDNSDPLGPDTFTFAILDGSGNEVPTLNPNGFDAFFEYDFPSDNSAAINIISGVDPSRTSIAIGAVSLDTPNNGPGNGAGNGPGNGPTPADTPEPGTLTMVIAGLVLIALGRRI
jgi:hypothetical protein